MNNFTPGQLLRCLNADLIKIYPALSRPFTYVCPVGTEYARVTSYSSNRTFNLPLNCLISEKVYLSPVYQALKDEL